MMKMKVILANSNRKQVVYSDLEIGDTFCFVDNSKFAPMLYIGNSMVGHVSLEYGANYQPSSPFANVYLLNTTLKCSYMDEGPQ